MSKTIRRTFYLVTQNPMTDEATTPTEEVIATEDTTIEATPAATEEPVAE